MAVCRRCESEHPPEELVRHERGDLLIVHCPDCKGLMGSYRDPAKRVGSR